MIDIRAMIDKILFVSREDRAMLRSNPSARTDADAWRGVSFLSVLPTCGNLLCIGFKAINLLVIFCPFYPFFKRTGRTYVHI